MTDTMLGDTGNQAIFDEADVWTEPVRNHEYALAGSEGFNSEIL
jgi:hypothetical protein